MNFFRSILSDEPDSPKSEDPDASQPDPASEPLTHSEAVSDDEDDDSDRKSASNADQTADAGSSGGGLWSFGGLIQTLTTRSESVLETYRRDLQEFGSGLRKESEILREVASRAVKDLPASIEVAHGAIDGVIKSTADIISHGKETLLVSQSEESETPDANRILNSGRYSRYEAQLHVIQNDVNTYCEEPEDLEDYEKWKSEFDLKENSEEIEGLVAENSGVLDGVYRRVVPNVVDHETFWLRYFYRVHKLKQQESLRANLVKRAISIDDEEELSWDVDDDDDNIESDEQRSVSVATKDGNEEPKENDSKDLPHSGKQESLEEGSRDVSPQVHVEEKGEVTSNVDNADDNVLNKEKEKTEQTSGSRETEKVEKSDESVVVEGKVDMGESGKESDVSIVSSQPSGPEEEDMGWDEIEDIGSGDEKKDGTTRTGSPNRADLRKRLSAAEEDEDLSWDIEDDDEAVKA